MSSCAVPGLKTLQIIECFLVDNLYIASAIEIAIFFTIIYYIYKHDPFHLVENHGAYVIFLILLIGFIFLMFFYFLKNRKKNFSTSDNPNPRPDKTNFKDPLILFLKKFATLFTLTVGGIIMIITIFWLFNNLTFLGSIALYILLAISLIIILAFLYIVFKDVLKPHMLSHKSSSEKTLYSFIIKLIFYIPCLLLSFIDYAKKQYEITSKPIWILLISELIIITLYFIIPFLIKNISFHESKQLLRDPVYTNNLTTLGTFENLSNKANKDKFNYNYGISFWLYINPQPPNTSASYTQYTSLFNYGNKPNILYNGKKNSLKIVCQNKRNDLVTIYETNDIKYQKWMHFIVNYNSGIVDVFIDKELVASKSGIAPYMTIEKVTAGTHNGINGGIKDVVYFNRIIPTNQIMLLFDSESDDLKKKQKNPPKFIKQAEDYISKDISNLKSSISEIEHDMKEYNKADSKKDKEK